MLQDDIRRRVRQGIFWDQVRAWGARHLGRLLEGFMERERDAHLGCAAYERSRARRGYRNGYQERRLETSWGPLVLRRPKVRGIGPVPTLVLDRYQRRQREVDRLVLDWLACGVSAREASRLLEARFGDLLSAGGVSRVVASLDQSVRAFHSRPLTHGYQFLYLDGKHGQVSRLRKRRGRGKGKKAVLLVAWGVRHDGSEELVDFRVADSESEACWTAFLTDLEVRGVQRRNRWNQALDMIVTDGEAGLREALWMVYPTVPKQRCVFHKVQDIADHLKDRTHRAAILSSAAAIYKGLTTPYQGIYRLGRWKDYWQEVEPEAVRNFAHEFEDTLSYLGAALSWQRRLKTTNPIERFIRELNKKTHKVGTYPSAWSWERMTYLVWEKLRTHGYAPTRRADLRAAFTPDT